MELMEWKNKKRGIERNRIEGSWKGDIEYRKDVIEERWN